MGGTVSVQVMLILVAEVAAADRFVGVLGGGSVVAEAAADIGEVFPPVSFACTS
jgi:hypothetical protein